MAMDVAHSLTGLKSRSVFQRIEFRLVLLFSFSIVGCSEKPEEDVQSELIAQVADSSETPADDGEEVESKLTVKPSELTDSTAANDGHADNRPKNHLANESSLYLRMHVRNPVDWYPWGAEAFAKAKKEGKLIFLSVGYSSCYWCHVMERESFEDRQIAKFLNDHFVCIKVDREERPDVDEIYMTAVQIAFGRGGWPMSVFMTPDAKPFFGGTYFPARDGDRGPGSRGFLTILSKIDEVWKSSRADIEKSADQITASVREHMSGDSPSDAPAEPTQEIIDSVTQSLAASFDPTYGGFGYDPADPHRPKFPEPSNLLFLLDVANRTDNEQAESMLITTLERMHMGGIWDHVGGGFHRYSTDRFWKIPHFEKMLYDNGQLLSVYAGAYELTKRDDFKRVVQRTVAYMNRELQSPDGAYFAAMDAESEKIEGKFYRWELPEIKKLLGEGYPLFAKVYGLDGAPNFEQDFFVPQLSESFAKVAKQSGLTEPELEKKLQPMRDKLLASRNNRPRPLTDNKIITSWNGLAIRGLADAGRILNDQQMNASAIKAANFVLANLRTTEGRLHRTFTDGAASLNGYLDDYAFLVDGLIALHKATDDDKWLISATELMEKQIELFWDDKNGAFFFTSNDHESLIARSKTFVDNVRPAGNSVSVENLIYLAQNAKRADYLQKAQTTMKAAAGLVRKNPGVAARMSTSFHTMLGN